MTKKQKIKNLIGSFLPRIHFSQEGEDIILRRLFAEKEKGFYVDIGAYHPVKYSNTYLLYISGWCGVNIEPNPDAKVLFKTLRRRDSFVNEGVSNKEEYMNYYKFNVSALNTFDEEEAIRKNNPPYKILKKIQIKTRPLSKILNENIKGNQVIDLMSIDAEGYDYEILLSNDWDIYQPRVVIVESLRSNLRNSNGNRINQFLEMKDYIPFSKIYNSWIYIKKEFFDETNGLVKLQSLNK